MSMHHFQLQGTWRGGLLGTGKIATGNLESTISLPVELRGPGNGTNSEELLLGAAATCYLTTLSAILERREVPVESLEITSEGEVVFEGPSPTFKRIIHRPRLELAAHASEAHRTAAREAAQMAEKGCMISRALRGNVTVTVDACLV